MPVSYSPARTICGQVRSGFVVPACLGDRVSDCGCTTAGRYALSGEGVGGDMEFSDFVRNTRRFFFPLQDDQELIQTIPPFFMPLRSAQRHGHTGLAMCV